MTEYDVAKLRAEQCREDAEQNGDAGAIEGETETIRWLESKEDEALNKRWRMKTTTSSSKALMAK